MRRELRMVFEAAWFVLGIVILFNLMAFLVHSPRADWMYWGCVAVMFMHANNMVNVFARVWRRK